MYLPKATFCQKTVVRFVGYTLMKKMGQKKLYF